MIYKAKDGRTFYDPLECEDYEKSLGVLPGSVGDFIIEMEKQTERNNFIFGIVKIQDGGNCSVYVRSTVCVDSLLEDYVNVENLKEEQRYAISTAGELIDTMKQLNQDAPCQYFILFADNIDLKCPGCMANYNKKAWKE